MFWWILSYKPSSYWGNPMTMATSISKPRNSIVSVSVSLPVPVSVSVSVSVSVERNGCSIEVINGLCDYTLQTERRSRYCIESFACSFSPIGKTKQTPAWGPNNPKQIPLCQMKGNKNKFQSANGSEALLITKTKGGMNIHWSAILVCLKDRVPQHPHGFVIISSFWSHPRIGPGCEVLEPWPWYPLAKR